MFWKTLAEVCLRIVLQLSIHVLHGRGLCASLLGGSSYVRERASQRSLRGDAVCHIEFHHWASISMLAALVMLKNQYIYAYSLYNQLTLAFSTSVLISILFSLISYWLSNFQPTAPAFFTWVLWIFLDLVAAESLVVFVTAVFPNFVIALALVAFANGLWMSVGGFLVSPTILNPFWRDVFHYIDYQVGGPLIYRVNILFSLLLSCGFHSKRSVET
ncbi:hypothetical protein VTN77DRAFT_3932 [Rasamsonia byssochlamydoides]|uniref:uncharacterized protein n=1 Tax=Rasamsonia byssochlamydoides TaxID=89139 RepID=UPI00374209E0